MNKDVKKVYDAYPPAFREPLLELRSLIYKVAAKTPEAGEITESLKWGQPTYTSKKGTPLRLDRFEENKIALFVHCQTSLIENFRSLFGDSLEFSKTRALVLDPAQSLPEKELTFFIEEALKYHAHKKSAKK